ncbi:MAG: sigma 54-interacting transcriptional regulator [Clostridiales bacterium]|nr:sigma 54-interacting transcriptional regulator [Clostridiales bacterium]MDD7347490.1 sigma 54-interacting transcriptional regulator [Clostridiales bacterium]MDY4061236.1 sigma 54-interacting transcriptional regulator [Anaerovoracaceae bacterium]
MNKNEEALPYGTRRVIEPQHVLPTSAWRLDNSRKIYSDEIRIDVKTVHLEGTSFKQICLESNNNEEKIKQRIIDIVIRRGKLHNPVTDTGGLFDGIVSEIGEDFVNIKGFKPGDEVVCNASLASVPLYIDRIISIDRAFGQIEVEGYAVITAEVPLVPKPKGVPTNLLLFTFNESGTLYRISNTAVGKRKILIVGNNLLSNLLFGYAVRKVARPDAEIVCLLDKKTDMVLKGESVNKLIKEVFSQVHYVDILKPLECLEGLEADGLFDVSVNCADIPGAETINILATKSGGTVVFANLINNYNIALYITESISRQLDIRCADGYLEAYDNFDIQLVKELMPYVSEAVVTDLKVSDDPSYPIGREDRLQMVSGQRQGMVEDFICESRSMTAVLDEILTVSNYDCNVLITGETGVGKEKVATMIHKNSGRKMQPFVKVNCASIAPSLIESELFGYEKGAFTGANEKGKKGYFELADNGILFLDEIGELALEVQAKLLRVIQDGEFFRVGGHSPVKCNVRIISATNRDLEDMIDAGSFRRDLYYRLNVVRIRVPNLAERVSDIPALVRFMLEKYGRKFDIKRTIDEDAVEYLKQSPWPGNIRELENVVQRLMISSKNERIDLLDIMRELHSDIFDSTMTTGSGNKITAPEEGSTTQEQVMDLEKMVNNFEKNILKYACSQFGSTRKAAKAVGISQTQLVRKKKKYGI